LVRHDVVGDVNFNPLGCLAGCIKQQAVPSMQAIKRAANQTKLEPWRCSHGCWFGFRPLISSPKMKKKQGFKELCPDT
jgi:hypothetical protein